MSRSACSQDAQALADLVDADQVAVVDVAVVAHGHVEVEAVVDRVGVGAADVVGHAGGAQHRPGRRVVRWPRSAVSTPTPSQRARMISFSVRKRSSSSILRGRRSKTSSRIFSQHALRQVARHAAEAEVVAHHARAGGRLEDIQDQLAFFEGVQRRGEEGAQVVEQEADGRQVVADAGQLGHDHADVLGALGRLDAHQLLDRQRVAEVVAHRARSNPAGR